MVNTFFKQAISEEVFKSKYCLHGENSADEVFRGVAREIASVEEDKEQWEETFYNAISSGELIPAGRILANARVNSPMKNYNNCFTIDIEDSIDGITTSIKEYMTIQSVGGGVGFNVSKLRPKGTAISKGGESSGPISFLEVFDASSKQIKVGGSRRAASIAILNINHPDIEEFITCKRGDDNKKLTQFNISVGITNKFMEAVKADTDWDLLWNGEVVKTIKAQYLYNLLCENAWNYNEPGALFLDRVNKDNNASHAFEIDRCNP